MNKEILPLTLNFSFLVHNPETHRTEYMFCEVGSEIAKDAALFDMIAANERTRQFFTGHEPRQIINMCSNWN